MRGKWTSIVAVLTLAAAAAAQPTALSYQGRLKNGGQPASGLHDFRFRLFDAAQGGNQLGDILCVNNLSVADGLFTAKIDFGQQFASPDARFLEIQVRADTGLGCGNGNGFVTLSPRQPITAAPIANHARSAFALDAADGGPADAVVVDNEGNVGIGITAPAARLDVRGGPMLVQNSGDQADLFWLASDRSWVFRQEGTGAGSALKLESIGGGGNKNFIVKTDGFMGLGTTLPLAKLDVRGDIRMGPSGQLHAAAGEENLRLVRGNVSVDGIRIAGAGFTVKHSQTGVYDITFSPPFSDTPTVVATPANEADTTLLIGLGTPSFVRVITQENFNLNDTAFSICVIGPR